MSWLQRFMMGRNGADQFSVALVCVSIVFSVLAMFFGKTSVPGTVIQSIGFVIILYSIFRMFSRNYNRRRRENAWFLRTFQPLYSRIGSFIGRRIAEHRDSGHRYFNCRTCHARLRVPKNRGTLQVTCPKCGKVIRVKS